MKAQEIDSNIVNGLSRLADWVGAGDLVQTLATWIRGKEPKTWTDVTKVVNDLINKAVAKDSKIRDKLSRDLNGLLSSTPIGNVQRELINKKLNKTQSDLSRVEEQITNKTNAFNDVKNDLSNVYANASKYDKANAMDDVINKAARDVQKIAAVEVAI